MKPYWGRNYANTIIRFDERVKSKQTTLVEKNHWLTDRRGFLHLCNMAKMPVSGTTSEASSIATFCFEITSQVSASTLLQQYLAIYPNQNIACQKLMYHVEIIDNFHTLLTVKELNCLFYLVRNITYQRISENLHVSRRTIESHVRSIIEKSIFDCVNKIIDHICAFKILGTCNNQFES